MKRSPVLFIQNFSGWEVYDEIKPGMKDAYDHIIKYGRDKNIDSRGLTEHLKKINNE